MFLLCKSKSCVICPKFNKSISKATETWTCTHTIRHWLPCSSHTQTAEALTILAIFIQKLQCISNEEQMDLYMHVVLTVSLQDYLLKKTSISKQQHNEQTGHERKNWLNTTEDPFLFYKGDKAHDNKNTHKNKKRKCSVNWHSKQKKCYFHYYFETLLWPWKCYVQLQRNIHEIAKWKYSPPNPIPH